MMINNNNNIMNNEQKKCLPSLLSLYNYKKHMVFLFYVCFIAVLYIQSKVIIIIFGFEKKIPISFVSIHTLQVTG